MSLIDDIRKDREAWWRPTPTDENWLAQLRDDYPENSHMSDDELREYYEGYQKFATTWDHIGDAYAEYEPLAESFLKMEAALLAAERLAEQAKNWLEGGPTYDGSLSDALATYRRATEGE